MGTSKTYKLYKVWYRPCEGRPLQNSVEETMATTALNAKKNIQAKHPGCRVTNAWPIKEIDQKIEA